MNHAYFKSVMSTTRDNLKDKSTVVDNDFFTTYYVF